MIAGHYFLTIANLKYLIMDSNELKLAIKELDKKHLHKRAILIENLNSFKKYLDPVYHVNNALPPKQPITVKINDLLDETILDATEIINKKIKEQSEGSILLKSGGSMATKIVSKTLHSNKTKIKAISLAIIKNILK